MQPRDRRKDDHDPYFSDEYDYHFKFHIVGDPGVGKTCLMLRFAKGKFYQSFISTIGESSTIKDVTVNEQVVRLQVCADVPQGQFRRITEHCTFSGTKALIIAFDLTDRTSFENVKGWLEDYKKKLVNPTILLVGTKSDDARRIVISQNEIDDFVGDRRNGIDDYVATSAKTGAGVDAVFEKAAKLVLDRLDSQKQKLDPREDLINDLDRYIKRIDRHDDPESGLLLRPDFGYGFLFFRKSRAMNREANYYLAKSLMATLQRTDEPISEVFDDVIKQRNDLIKEYGLDVSMNRGINSSELNDIIGKATRYANSEKRPLLRSTAT